MQEEEGRCTRYVQSRSYKEMEKKYRKILTEKQGNFVIMHKWKQYNILYLLYMYYYAYIKT